MGLDKMGDWKPKGSPDGDGLRREYEAGRISADSYIAAGGDPDGVRSVEAKKAADEAAKKAEAEKSGRRIALGCIGIPVLLVGGCMALTVLGSGGSDGGGAGGPLRETEAQVACERGVRDEVGGRPTFKHGVTSAISGGFEVLGRGTLDGVSFGYVCEVTGPSGSHRTAVQITE